MKPWKTFEEDARMVLEEYFKTDLEKGNPWNSPKCFDFVSDDEDIVGDAKYLSMVRGKGYPPAKMMEICGHVWLLQKLPAKTKFLIFGNQMEVVKTWLHKYGDYKRGVNFYFLNSESLLYKNRNNNFETLF